MKRSPTLFLFFIILPILLVSCKSPNSVEIADSYGMTEAEWKQSVEQTCAHPEDATVFVSPGDNIQKVVSELPPGSSILFREGTYRNQTIKPKDEMIFFAASSDSVILDGGKKTKYAFLGSNERGVVIANRVGVCNITIQYYTPGVQMGAIKAGGHTSISNTSGWFVKNVTSQHNYGGGIRVGDNMKIVGGRYHQNSQIGIVGGANNLIISDVEVDSNNVDFGKLHDYTWEAGGIKLVESKDVIIIDSNVHDNHGPGIWFDINSSSNVVEWNLVSRNAAEGIFQEIGGSITIRHNTVRRNGHDRKKIGPYGAGILIGHSNGAEVHHNTVEDNKNGILGIQQERLDYGGPHLLDSLRVHHNVIVQREKNGWAAGVFDGNGNVEVFRRNIKFDHNTYILKGPDSSWRWKLHSNDWDKWRNWQDFNSSLN